MNTLGEIIRIERIQHNLTLEELAGTSCSVSALSRIELGQSAPSRRTAEALLQKLNLPLHLLDISLSPLEKEVAGLIRDIQYSISNSNLPALRKQYKALKLKVGKSSYYADVLGLTKISIMQLEGASFEVLYTHTLDLIKKEQPHFDSHLLEKLLLTNTHIAILNHLAFYEMHYALDQSGHDDLKKEAVHIWKNLKTYISKKDKIAELPQLYTKIIEHLSSTLFRSGDYKKCISLAKEGIKICIQYDTWTSKAALLELEGFAFLSLHDTTGAQLIREAYMLYYVRGECEKADALKEKAHGYGVEVLA